MSKKVAKKSKSNQKVVGQKAKPEKIAKAKVRVNERDLVKMGLNPRAIEIPDFVKEDYKEDKVLKPIPKEVPGAVVVRKYNEFMKGE